MAKNKKPRGVRFDMEVVEEIRSAQGIVSYQSVLNYLTDLYKAGKYQAVESTRVKAADQIEVPPPGLTGIDLTIWKREQKAKS